MKAFVLALIVAVFGFGVALPEAEAKRLGSGSSLGMQRQTTPQQPASAPQQSISRQQQAGTPPQQAPQRSWLGPIAGLAAGLGLAALFSHLGLGEELASLLMLALLIGGAFLVFRLLFRRASPPQSAQAMQYAGAGVGGAAHAAPPASSSGPAATPAGFDADAFARQAKVNFIRLQAANDAGNLDDLREFTTPEMFAELRLQLADRGTTAQQTDVVELHADVIEVVEDAGRYIVSVRFSGLIREDADAPPAPFAEIWHLTKPVAGTRGWVIAGIQQLN